MRVFTGIGLCLFVITSFVGCRWFSCCCRSSDTKETLTAKKESAILMVTSAEDFEKKISTATKPVVVDFGASWCGYCQKMKPIFRSIANELNNKYLFIEVDTDAAGSVSQKFGIRGLPTFIFIKDGHEVDPNKRIIGMTDKETFVKTITDVFGK